MAKYRPDINFIFPNAPTAPVTLNMGMRMPSWFDIKGLDENAAEDKEVCNLPITWSHLHFFI